MSLSQMIEWSGLKPDAVTYQVRNRLVIRCHFSLNSVFTLQALLAACQRNGEVQQAMRVFQSMVLAGFKVWVSLSVEHLSSAFLGP